MVPRQVTLDFARLIPIVLGALALAGYVWYAGAWKRGVDIHVETSEKTDAAHEAQLEKQTEILDSVVENLTIQRAIEADRLERLQRRSR